MIINPSSSSIFQSNPTPDNQFILPINTKDMKKSDFKTSNPNIFPSLHPLSKFYKQKPDSDPILTIKGSEADEPFKKVKFNNSSHKLVLNTENYIQERSKQINESLNINSQNGVLFSIPKLPKRLSPEPDIKIPENRKLRNIFKIQKDLRSINETQIKKDKFSAFETKKPIQENFLTKNNNPNQVRNEMTDKYPDVCNQMLDPRILNILYEQFKIEFYCIQLKRNLLDIYQESHEKQAKSNFNDSNFANDIFQQDKNNKIVDFIKKENLKQEVGCC